MVIICRLITRYATSIGSPGDKFWRIPKVELLEKQPGYLQGSCLRHSKQRINIGQVVNTILGHNFLLSLFSNFNHLRHRDVKAPSAFSRFE